MRFAVLALSTVLFLGAAGDDKGAAGDDKSDAKKALPGDRFITPDDCSVSLIEEREVPAGEAGTIMALEAREGMLVKEGTVLGKVDDREATAQKRIKLFEYQAAKEQAENDVDIRYATEASQVAYFTWQKHVEANRTQAKTTPEVELKRLELDYRRAVLQIEKARRDQKVAKSTMDMKGAEVHAADLNIQRRLIRSPIDGTVVKVPRRVGEWAGPGDTVLRIMRFDRLHIKGTLQGSQYGPEEIKGRKVTVQVELARKRQANANGKIVFVSPEVGLDGRYEVWAEISNWTEGDEWVLRPGLPATMKIDLSGDLASARSEVRSRKR